MHHRRTGSAGGALRLAGRGEAWPRFGPRVGRMGVHSALALPLLLLPDRVVGAIGVYSHAKDVFDEHAERLGEMFARPAAAAVHNAQVLAEALR
ncbi:GAF domain-containing protein [Mycobacterium antarcticum]|uniref:GAF domain-containing protein n=1 Tax=Mycolicibacterium sp. TUM20985 TaxID=3023370 RepID=UPI0033658409